jgi:hypothetical protein
MASSDPWLQSTIVDPSLCLIAASALLIISSMMLAVLVNAWSDRPSHPPAGSSLRGHQ